MAVVVDHPHAAPLADELEAPSDPGKATPSARSASPRSTPASPSTASAVAAFARLCSPGTPSSLETELELPAADGIRRSCEPVVEERGELRLRGVRRVMVELDVRHGGDLRPQKRDRPVRLVALDDEPALPHARVSAELRDDAADDPRRIVAELAQRVRDHGCGGRLSVRAADDDRAAERDELGEELGARAPLHAAGVRRRHDDLRSPRAATAHRRYRHRRREIDSRKIVSRASHPPTSAPQARAKFAYAERPAPPMPTK